MPELYVQVKNKIAINSKPIVPVCDNNDYIIIFDFDEEWNSLKTKTARFIYNNNYTDVIFDDNKCPLPIIRNTNSFTVGVFAGDLHTTTPAYFRVNRSILSGTETPAPPEESSVYNTIMKKLNQISEDANRTNENIGSLSDLETESKDTLVAAINEAVLYTAQSLTEEQKEQARANIGCSEIATEEDIAILLTNQGYIYPVGANDGVIYTDNNDKIYVL